MVAWRDFWGTTKRTDLLASLESGKPAYQAVAISAQGKWSFRPQAGSAGYSAWPKVTELCELEPISGLAEMRRGGLISVNSNDLVERMTQYFDPAQTYAAVSDSIEGLGVDAGRYPAERTRIKILAAGDRFSQNQIRRYALFPFDHRWCYHSNSRPIWNEPRPELAEQFWQENRALICRVNARRPEEGWPISMTSALPDYHFLDPNARAIPLRWRTTTKGRDHTTANLSPLARAYLTSVGIPDPDANEHSATALWHYALAVAYSPAWLNENGPAIRADFPRVPLARRRAVLDRGADLGRQLADLLDPDRPVAGVTTGTVRPDLRPLGQLTRNDGQAIDPASDDLRVAARWGALQRGSVVMPGPGRTTPNPAGGRDVWLNDRVCIAQVPDAVWAFTIGGYQVIKKWLSYREHTVLGRSLTLDEARHLTAMVRRLATVIALAPTLDRVYQDAVAATWTATESVQPIAKGSP